MRTTNKQQTTKLEQLNAIADRLRRMQLDGNARFAMRMRLTVRRVAIMRELEADGVNLLITADGETVAK